MARNTKRNQKPLQEYLLHGFSDSKWCGPGSPPTGRQGTDILMKFFNPISFQKTKNPNIAVEVFVVWAGIEPATQGFSVLCSTD